MDSPLNEFEREVIETLATLKERTHDLPEMRTQVTAIATKVARIEERSAIFGAIAGTIFAAVVGTITSIFKRGS